MSEKILRSEIVERLKDDFEVLEEISGYHPIYDARLRIDVLLRAKPHLVAEGFTDDWFGVECKWVKGVVGQTSKTTRLVWQSITYAQSEFEVVGKKVTPRFVAIFTPNSLPHMVEQHLGTLLALGLYGCVGKLYFYRDGTWGVKFAGIYARKNQNGYYISQEQLPKIRAGSV